jgi:cobalt-zinc-cadmium efflux system membrane fusion protein
MIRHLQFLAEHSLRYVGMVVPLVLLAALGWWGYRNEWKVKKFSEWWGPAAAAEKDPAEAEDNTPLPIDAPPMPDSVPPDLKPLKFTSLAVLHRAGVKLARVEERSVVERVSAYGVVDYDQTLYAHLSTRAPGIVWKVLKTYGDHVKKGEVLAIIDAAELGRAKADFLNDLVQLSVRTRALQQLQATPGSSLPERMLRDAEGAVRESRMRLFNAQQALSNLGLPVLGDELSNLSDQQAARQVRVLGLPPEVLKGEDPDKLPATLLPMKAPFDGVVVNRELVNGEQVVASHDSPQFVLADVRRLTMLLEVRLEDVGQVKKDQEIVFRPNGSTEKYKGKLYWLSVEADSKTRTVKARADLDNPEGHLRPQTFGTATIQVGNNPRALVVPDEAIQSDGHGPVVFVQVGERTFQPRRVTLGIKDGNLREIREGVRAGELVAREGSHVLKAEMFKDRIGGDD